MAKRLTRDTVTQKFPEAASRRISFSSVEKQDIHLPQLRDDLFGIASSNRPESYFQEEHSSGGRPVHKYSDEGQPQITPINFAAVPTPRIPSLTN